MAGKKPPARSLKEVADVAGLSSATVSYALRGDAKIPLETRERVRAIAARLGYHKNPRLANMMSFIRRTQHAAVGERIAFVWMRTPRADSDRNAFLRFVFEGARARAEQMGFSLEEFWTDEPGMTDSRLEQILRARGIVGVVLSPLISGQAGRSLQWDWSHFASAVIGSAAWEPELHHAGHHHYLGMRQALLELQRLGCRRPAAVIERESNERAKRAWEAAFITHLRDVRDPQALLQMPPRNGGAQLAGWLRRVKPDALVIGKNSLLDSPGLVRTARTLGIPIATLYWGPDPALVGGIDQCFDRVAAHAVDLVVAQLNNNETGVPDLPRMMLLPGRWMTAATTTPALAAPTAAR